MKKILAVSCIAAILALGLSACNNDASSTPAGGASGSDSSTVSTPVDSSSDVSTPVDSSSDMSTSADSSDSSVA